MQLVDAPDHLPAREPLAAGGGVGEGAAGRRALPGDSVGLGTGARDPPSRRKAGAKVESQIQGFKSHPRPSLGPSPLRASVKWGMVSTLWGRRCVPGSHEALESDHYYRHGSHSVTHRQAG